MANSQAIQNLIIYSWIFAFIMSLIFNWIIDNVQMELRLLPMNQAMYSLSLITHPTSHILKHKPLIPYPLSHILPNPADFLPYPPRHPSHSPLLSLQWAPQTTWDVTQPTCHSPKSIRHPPKPSWQPPNQTSSPSRHLPQTQHPPQSSIHNHQSIVAASKSKFDTKVWWKIIKECSFMYI